MPAAKLLESATGWLIAATLAVAPFLFGGTTEPSMRTLNGMAGGAAALWLALLVVERRMPRVSWLVIGPAAMLLIQGWVMALHPQGVFDPQFYLYAKAVDAPGLLPSAVDEHGARLVMWRLTVLLPFFLAITDLCRRTRWLTRFVRTMAAAGVGLAAFGIWQKAAFQPFQIWPVERAPSHAFATFWYHGNAAALMNLAWPLAATCAVWTFVRGGAHVSRALWVLGWLILMVGIAFNGSKAGHLLTALMLGLIMVLAAIRVKSIIASLGWQQVMIAAAALIIGLAVLLSLDEVSLAIERWKDFLARKEWDSRIAVAGQSLALFQERPALGHGPGSFMAAFQLWLTEHGGRLRPVWKFAHNDYVQSLVEWGVVGTAAWMLIWGRGAVGAAVAFWELVKPALVVVRRRSRRSRERWRKSVEAMRHVHLLGGSISLIGLLIHAAMDFPLQIYSIQLYGLCLVGMLSARGE